MKSTKKQRRHPNKKLILLLLGVVIVIVSVTGINTYSHQKKMASLTKASIGEDVSEEKLVELAKEKGSVGTEKQSVNKIVYLTFDDGPSKVTKDVLDVLDREKVKATFFVTGLNPEYFYMIKDASSRGHSIGLHTYSHDYSKVYASKEKYYADLHQIGRIVEDEIGISCHYIRFPGGTSNTVSREYSKGLMTKITKEINDKGFQYYDWNVDSGDAAGNNVNVKTIVKNATSSSENNIVLLMHDANGKETTAKALPNIIKHYREKGYEFKALDDDAFVAHHPTFN